MKKRIRKIFLISIIIILVSNLLITVLVGYITLKYPDNVSAFLTQYIPKPTPVPFQIRGIGVIGDSQSDEYTADDKRGSTYEGTTLNWVEILAKVRNLNFGAWGEWDEPRRSGYAYNWARTGATTLSMIESGQHTGLAEQVKDGEVNLVIVYIGANDFAPYLPDGYQQIYDGTIFGAALYRKLNDMSANIKTAIETIQNSGDVKVLLVLIPDWGDHIGVFTAFPDPTGRSRVSDAVNYINTDLTNWANTKQIAIADPNEFYYDLLWKNSDMKVGNITLNKVYPSDDPHYVFLSDGIHPGTIFNGLFANFLIQKMNSELGTDIRPLSDQEIINAAGL